MSHYAQQNRGDLDAYARYLANMDAAMKHKVALTAAHLPSEGQVADMGMGSGSGSEALAALYPRLKVVGVDVNPTMVEIASRQYVRDNLSFLVGDIAEPCFPAQSLHGIVNSSVLHHVTSYNGYRACEAERALQAQAAQLDSYGTLIVRDFLAPESQTIELRLPPSWLETWQRFAREFRGLAPVEERGFAYRDLGLDDRGWQRIEVEQWKAVEFVLRKDYQEDWATEILEQYTYFRQDEFEAHFQALGLRVLVSTPLFNPWILQNRFEGQFEFYQGDTLLDYPPTNYLIVGEKVPQGEGVRFRPAAALPAQGFLEKVCYRHRESGKVFDLIRRPHPTVDVLPYSLSEGGNLSVLVRHSYPRPILSQLSRGLDGLTACGYTVEPITALQGEHPLGETVEQILQVQAGIAAAMILSMQPGQIHYPSPGGIREEVHTCFVHVTELDRMPTPQAPLMWSHCGQIRALDAHQLLRSAQVNGLSDHRLEMHIFSLMRKLAIDPGPWLGDRLQTIAHDRVVARGQLDFQSRRLYSSHPVEESPNFLRVVRHEYEELDRDGKVLTRGALESVEPGKLSCQTVVALPMIYQNDQWWVGLDLDDLPAAQAFSGNSCLWVAPAWRLPHEVTRQNQMRQWIGERLLSQMAVTAVEWAPLGGPYFPSPGLTPELVYPLAVRVEVQPHSSLKFFPLAEIMDRWEDFRDGHLRCALLRAHLAHSHS